MAVARFAEPALVAAFATDPLAQAGPETVAAELLGIAETPAAFETDQEQRPEIAEALAEKAIAEIGSF